MPIISYKELKKYIAELGNKPFAPVYLIYGEEMLTKDAFEELLDALLILLAGIVLLTPGFLTDLAGLMILIPITRLIFKRWLRKKFDEWISRKRIDVTFHH